MSLEPIKENRQGILIEDAIYTEYDLNGISERKFAEFVLREGALDAYCPQCEKNSVFHIDGDSFVRDKALEDIPKTGLITITANCTRDGEPNLLGMSSKCSGRLDFCFYKNANELIKIGQYPSKATLDFNSLDEVFSKELDSLYRDELGRAVGLRAHGVGVGSFVYLRRIFENLVDEAHQVAQKNNEWDEKAYQESRMPEKINLLSHQLPNRLVKNSNLYGILSKGIHDLDEEECLAHFDLVLEAIKMILKERHEKKEYDKILNDLNNTASDIED